MTKFKVGDRFIPRKPKKNNTGLIWRESMDKYDGKELTVDGIDDFGRIQGEESGYMFHPDWCEKVEEVDEEPFIIATTNHETGITYVELPIRDAMTEARACGISGIPNNQEHIPETDKTIDWEQRKWEVVMGLGAARLSRVSLGDDSSYCKAEIKFTIDLADEMIKQLKSK